MRHGYLLLASFAVLSSALGINACSSGGGGGGGPEPDASPDGTTVDAGGGADAAADADATTPGMDAGKDADATTTRPDAGEGPDAEGGAGAEAGDGGGASEAATSPAQFLAHFDPAQGQNAEGLWEITDAGVPVVGFAPLATLVTVGADGGVQTLAKLTDASASNTFTLGIISPTRNGNIFVGVGTTQAADAGPEAGAVVPAPGVYRGGVDGGFSLWASAPTMRFANGFDIVNNELFVADSGGTIFRIDMATAAVSTFSTDPLLAPNIAACTGKLGLSIGANGIVHIGTDFYVTNTNYGRIVKIPMDADGGAGAASVLVEDCAALEGADGLVVDTKDNSLLVAVNIQDKILRVSTTDGGTSVLTAGSPLDAPASVLIDSMGADGGRRLLFTNASFFSSPDAAVPGLLALPIP